MQKLLFLILTFLTVSCQISDDVKINHLLNIQELKISVVKYGGLPGRIEAEYKIKKNQYDTLLILNEGTDYQTFIKMNNANALLRNFLKEAFVSNDPDKIFTPSCIGPYESEYFIRGGLIHVNLKPNLSSDSIFQLFFEEY